MKTPLLLGTITALLFGSFALSGYFAQAGPNPNEIIVVTPGGPQIAIVNLPAISIATCPMTHQVIGGGIHNWVHPHPEADSQIQESLDLATNSYNVTLTVTRSGDPRVPTTMEAFAICQKINFPMGGMSLVGGELLDIDTMALFIGAIGVNPIITGLVAISMGGVAAQAIWYVNSRRKKSENS